MTNVILTSLVYIYSCQTTNCMCAILTRDGSSSASLASQTQPTLAIRARVAGSVWLARLAVHVSARQFGFSPRCMHDRYMLNFSST